MSPWCRWENQGSNCIAKSKAVTQRELWALGCAGSLPKAETSNSIYLLTWYLSEWWMSSEEWGDAVGESPSRLIEADNKIDCKRKEKFMLWALSSSLPVSELSSKPWTVSAELWNCAGMEYWAVGLALLFARDSAPWEHQAAGSRKVQMNGKWMGQSFLPQVWWLGLNQALLEMICEDHTRNSHDKAQECWGRAVLTCPHLPFLSATKSLNSFVNCTKALSTFAVQLPLPSVIMLFILISSTEKRRAF